MSEFIEAVSTHSFLAYALLVSIFSSIACGVIGTYVVSRRITFIAGGLAHCVLGGIGAAHYLKVVHGWQHAHPLLGAVISALAAAGIIGWVGLRAREREDTVIGALWAIGMASGVLFLHQTPGYNKDLMQYLFGNILLVTEDSLWIAGLLDVLVVGTGILFFNQFQAICFDEEHARLRGIQVEWLYFLLLGLTALTVVLLSTVVGIVMVIALLTLPVALAGMMTRTLAQMMVVATLLSIFFTTTGLAISYGPNFPPGATIIVLTGSVYFIALIGRSLFFWKRERTN